MRNITLEELLEAGCHFGHQVTRQNPKARDFVFEARENIHIIDLEKTKQYLEEAGAFIKSVAQQEGSSILILGTKKQVGAIIKEEVTRAQDAGVEKMYRVTNRWMGGTFTNFDEIHKNSNKLKDLKEKLKNELERMKYTKKEILMWDREKQKLEIFYGGVVDMTKKPDVIFIVDTHTEAVAVRESNDQKIAVVGIVDTNADPDPIKYPIPANDDATGSVKLILSYIVDAWIEGKKEGPVKPVVKEEKKTEKKKAEDKEEIKDTKEAKKPAKKAVEKKDAAVKETPKKAPVKKTTKKAAK